MVDPKLLDELGTLATRRRWLLGLSIGRGCRRLHVALVGIEGHGLSCRASVFAHRRAAVPPPLVRRYQRLCGRHGSRIRAGPAEAALLAAQLAEAQAELVDEFSADIAPVWGRLTALAVGDFALWHRRQGMRVYLPLSDAARLAELTGQNVIDAFAARDLAQDGRGRPLSPLPDWLLLRDAQKSRLVVQFGKRVALCWLLASREASGTSRCGQLRLELPADTADSRAAWLEAAGQRLRTLMPPGGRVDQLVVSEQPQHRHEFLVDLAARLGGGTAIEIVSLADLGVPAGSLAAARAALLGMLHVDQVPANLVTMTGARAPRVLGRLTPGSYTSWHRLMRELATAKPAVVALRTAV